LAFNAAATGNTGAALDELSRLEQMLGNDPPIVQRSGSSSALRPRRRIATSARADGRSLVSASETSGGRSSSSSKRPRRSAITSQRSAALECAAGAFG
jgi:hypothetical protein